jgi:hypothetical protein
VTFLFTKLDHTYYISFFKIKFLFVYYSFHLHPNLINQTRSLLDLVEHVQPTKQIMMYLYSRALVSLTQRIQARLDHADKRTDPKPPSHAASDSFLPE